MDDWQTKIFALPGILLGLTVHECCHALCSYKLGDDTAKEQGRITLNPLKHIDPVGFIFILIAGFGWAKPVQFNPEKLSNLRRDKALIAAAGPLSNLVLGVLLTLLVKAYLFLVYSGHINFSENLLLVLFYAAAINFGLLIFNLLPIPPLDGSHIAFSGLNTPPELESRIRQIGMPLLFVILIVQHYADITIIPIGKWINAIMDFILGGLLSD
jgi:Zn-dependent protease